MIPRLASLLIAGFFVVPSANAQPPALPRTDALGDPLPRGAIARLGTLRFKHDPGQSVVIRNAVFSPDGKKFASLASNESIRLWDVSTGKELPGPWSSKEIDASAIAFSPDGAILAAATIDQPSGNKPIIQWDIAKRKLLRTIVGNRKSMVQLVFAKDGKTLLTAGEDDTVRWWDVATGEERRSWQIPTDKLGLPKKYETMSPRFQYSFSPGGNYLAVRVTLDADRSLPFAPANWYVIVFELAGGASWDAQIRGNYHTDLAFAFSPDGKLAAVSASPNKVHLHDTATGKVLTTHDLEVSSVKGGIKALHSLLTKNAGGLPGLWERRLVGFKRCPETA